MKNTNTLEANKHNAIIPPHAPQLEQSVIACLLSKSDKIDDVIELLPTTESFYKPENALIYKYILSMYKSGSDIDMLTIASEMMKPDNKHDFDAIGGFLGITKASDATISYANVVNHARIVAEKYKLRQISRLASELTSMVNNANNPFEIASFAERQFNLLQSVGNSGDLVHISKIVDEVNQNIIDVRESEEDLSQGVYTGFKTLQENTNGWQKSELIILAARPAVGKTAFALNLALNGAVNGSKIAVFCLEMSSLQITKRVISNFTTTQMDSFKRPKLMSDEVTENLINESVKLRNVPIYLDESFSTSLPSLVNKCRRLHQTEGLDMVIIDYLQLMSSGNKGGSREQEISAISRGLKGLAKELNIPVIALSQLSRALEARAGDKGKIPQLSDLRESGAIEQDADMVLFIHRPEYNGQINDENGESLKGVTFINCAKNRSGELFEMKLKAQLEYQKFIEEEPTYTFDDADIQDLQRNSFSNTNITKIAWGNEFEQAPY